MKTAYGKLTALIAVLVIGTLLFAPMRFGGEDYLYAHPRSVRLNPGDSYALSYRLDADEPQAVAYTSTNEAVATVDADGIVTAVSSGRAQIRLDAEKGARATVQIEVKGGENGKLYGAITNEQIAAALKEQHGIEIDKRKLEQEEPIRTAGQSFVTLKLMAGISTRMIVNVRVKPR